MNWFECSGEIDRHRDVLERILALLLLMAGLADHAAGLSARRRLHVLAILAGGESGARDFFIGPAGAPVEGDLALRDFASVRDAERLAAGFRVLALVLAAMLAQVRRPASAGVGGRQTVLLIAHCRPAGPTRLPLRALPAPDTS